MSRSMSACGVLFGAIGLAAIASDVSAAGGRDVGTVLFGASFLAGAALFFWIARWPVYDRGPLEETELLRLGRPATATVVAVGPGALTLQVSPANERPFRAQAPPARGSVPAVGDEVRVRFDPGKRKHLVVTG